MLTKGPRGVGYDQNLSGIFLVQATEYEPSKELQSCGIMKNYLFCRNSKFIFSNCRHS